MLAGLLGYSAVMVILLFDLGRWDRFYNVFFHPNLSSALLEVSWCITAYSLILVYELSPVLLENTRLKWLLPTIKKYVIPIVIVGVTLSTMHQSPGNDVRHHVTPAASTLAFDAAARVLPDQFVCGRDLAW